MAPVVAMLEGLWKAFNVEFVIFFVTLTFAFLFRGMSTKLSVMKPAKTWREPGEGAGGPSCSPATKRPRREQPLTPGSAPSPTAQTQAKVLPRGPTAAAMTSQRKAPPAAQVVDDVVEGLREQPGMRFAAKALELYAELKQQLQQRGLRLPDAARGSRHSMLDFYSTLVQCVVRVGQCHMVEEIMEDMIHQGISRPLLFYESTMKQLAGQKHYHLALAVYDRLEADGLEPSAVTCSCLINFAAEIGELDRAICFFKKLAATTTPSIRAYMTVLRVHGRRQDWSSSLTTFRDMQRRGVHVDSLVLNVILATGVSAGQIDSVEGLLAEADGYKPPITDVVSYNTVAKCYAQHNDLDGAKSVIARIWQRGLKPNAITFNSVMDAAVRSRRSAEAWDLLKEMRRAGLRPDKYTCSILVKGLVHEATPQQVRNAIDLLHEVDKALDKTLRTTLFHTVIEAAGQTGDAATLAYAFAQAGQHQVTPPASAYRRLREVAEVAPADSLQQGKKLT